MKVNVLELHAGTIERVELLNGEQLRGIEFDFEDGENLVVAWPFEGRHSLTVRTTGGTTQLVITPTAANWIEVGLKQESE